MQDSAPACAVAGTIQWFQYISKLATDWPPNFSYVNRDEQTWDDMKNHMPCYYPGLEKKKIMV